MQQRTLDSFTTTHEHKCPTCGRTDFESESGMKVHHAAAHGESLARVTLSCEWCETEFEYRADRANQRRFCSEECKNEWQRESDVLTGEDHPNWEGGKERIECNFCGTEFEAHPAKQRKYCSERCMGEYFSEEYSGEDSWRWNDRVTLECEICHEEYDRPRHREKQSRFCSQECTNQHLREQSGSDHRWWEGGEVEIECEICGDTVTVKQNVAEDRRFCSVSCMGEWRSSVTGESHPSYEAGKATVECDYCGDEYKITPAKRERSSFCSKECMGEWYSVHQSGQDHPGWRGGKSVYDAVKRLLSDEPWEYISDAHREENPQCRICGSQESLHTHHIVPVMAGGTNEEWNRMTLCVSCHGQAEAFTRNYVDSVLVELD